MASNSGFTLCLKRSTTVPIKSVDDKRQITETFTISATGAFLPIPLIYQGATESCSLKYKFPKEFNITYTNHWSNLEKFVDLFENIILPYLRAKKIVQWISARTIFTYHYGHL